MTITGKSRHTPQHARVLDGGSPKNLHRRTLLAVALRRLLAAFSAGALLAGLGAVVVPGVAAATPPTSLAGEELTAAPTVSFKCFFEPSGRATGGHVTFSITNGAATGPYNGTFTAGGTIDVNEWVWGPVSEQFTITSTSPPATIIGTKTIGPGGYPSARGGAGFNCSYEGLIFLTNLEPLEYHATISPAYGGAGSDSGQSQTSLSNWPYQPANTFVGRFLSSNGVVPVPHYFSNAVLVGSEPTTVLEWGAVTLKTGGGEVTCHTASVGSVENPAGGAVSVGATKLFDTLDCESSTCPYTSVVKADSLPWPSVLEEEGTSIRAHSTGIKINVDCVKEGKSEGSETFVGNIQPSTHQGTSALHPGFLEYDSGSGTLEKEGSGGTVTGKIEGETKLLGYDEQELINIR